MKKHLIFVLIFIIVVPIWTISLIWNSTIENENDAIRYRFEKVLEGRLGGLVAEAGGELAKIERSLLDTEFSTEDNPLVFEAITLDKEGRALSPEAKEKTADNLYPIARDMLLAIRAGSAPESPGRQFRIQETFDKTADYGWHTRFDSQGIRLFFWRWTPEENFSSIELNRPVFLDRIAKSLPAGNLPFKDAIVLSDEFGQMLNMWGEKELIKSQVPPQASLPLPYPLNIFKLYYFTQEAPQINLEFFTLVLAVSCSLFILGGYFFWEHMRTIDDTAQKVSFVNQVSHELKTPLTNIRLYAELLKESLGEDEAARKKIEIIEAESQRLSRLIKNVLSFSAKGQIHPNPQKSDINNIISKVVDSFRPGLEKKGMVVHLDCKAEEAVVDTDILEQILTNLVSNVEKYAPEGKYLGIETFKRGEKLHIRVSDKGGGIPEKLQKRIFKPFVRAHDKTTEGVSGTGIGLSLSKDLAERHGGKIILASTEKGSCFEVVL